MNKSTKEEIIKMRTSGLILKDIAARLNDKGELSPTGTKWTNQIISAFLIKWGYRHHKKRKGFTSKRGDHFVKKSDDKRALLDLVITSQIDKGSKLKLIEALIE